MWEYSENLISTRRLSATQVIVLQDGVLEEHLSEFVWRLASMEVVTRHHGSVPDSLVRTNRRANLGSMAQIRKLFRQYYLAQEWEESNLERLLFASINI